jgi:hypothetical protein
MLLLAGPAIAKSPELPKTAPVPELNQEERLKSPS